MGRGSNISASTFVIEPYLRTPAATKGYRPRPPQERPVIMNTKSPTASGKSTLHPLQRMLAGGIGISLRPEQAGGRQ